jgi:hypothetical protein
MSGRGCWRIGARADLPRRLCVLIVILIAVAAMSRAEAQPRRQMPGDHLARCTIEEPDAFPDLPAAEEATGADNGDDDDDDDDDDDGEEASSPGELKTLSIRSSRESCLFFSGEVRTGYEFTRFIGPSARLIGTRGLPGTITTAIGTITLTHVTRSDLGDIVTRFSADASAGDFALTEASVGVGRFIGGLTTSLFDVWSGDEFSFRALASSQSPMLAAWKLASGPNHAVVVSFEEPSFRRVTLTGYAGVGRPDVVARFSFRRGPAQVVISGAQHETRLADADDPTLQGYALQASLRLDLPALSDDSYLIAQAAYADRALGYLGINTASNTLGITLPGFLNAAVAERGHGVSGSFALIHQLSGTWRLGGFLSASSIELVERCASCTLKSLRGAANITWMPVAGVELALEAGGSAVQSTIPGLPSGRRWSLITSLTRTF